MLCCHGAVASRAPDVDAAPGQESGRWEVFLQTSENGHVLVLLIGSVLAFGVLPFIPRQLQASPTVRYWSLSPTCFVLPFRVNDATQDLVRQTLSANAKPWFALNVLT